MEPEAMHAAYTAWLATQEQSSPCQEVAFAAGWQAAMDWQQQQAQQAAPQGGRWVRWVATRPGIRASDLPPEAHWETLE